MEFGDPEVRERGERSRLDVVLDRLDGVYAELLDIVGGGGLELLDAAGKVSFWQRFEAFRNRLPLLEHVLIADAEATDLAGGYGFSGLARFLVRMFLLSPGEAASRVRAAAAVGPRISMLGERLEPVLPRLAALQRDGAVTIEKVQIVERAMHRLSRPGLNPADVAAAERLLTDYAPVLGPADLRRYALRVVDAADPDGPEPVDDQLQQDRRYLELRQRRDGMWHVQGRLTATVGAQLQAVLDPLARFRSSSIADQHGTTIQLPDERPAPQRLHDGLDEACGRLLKSADQPAVGGIPASVIITVPLQELCAKAGLAETGDGTLVSIEQLSRIADEAEIWPAIVDRHNIPLLLGRSQRLASRGQTMALITRDGGCSFPGCSHPPSWCDRHHIIDWIDGGPTDLANLTLLCRYHHTHFLQKGWSCRSNRDGLPEWIPPRCIDPAQRPQLNTRIRRLHAQQQLGRRRRPAA
jgi:Domain of unknown function (DUF222)/HNH endonuclease